MNFYYLASRAWMESEILAGHAVKHRQRALDIEPDNLDRDWAQRAEMVRDATEFTNVHGRRRVCVLDSGIAPELRFGPTEDQLEAFDQPIIETIGWLPEISAPTNSAAEVIKAWESWIEAYKELAQRLISKFNDDPPAEGLAGVLPIKWADGIDIQLTDGVWFKIKPTDGTDALSAARAGRLWNWASTKRFSAESIEAAREAIGLGSAEARRLVRESDSSEIARAYLEREKRGFLAAKAYDAASKAASPDFDAEMERWATERGSSRLRLGLEDGYRMNSRYLAERIASEAPGMYAMPVDSAKKGWATKAASPSESALRLRRRIAASMKRNAPPGSSTLPETEIVTVRKPPHQIYLRDPGIETEYGLAGSDLPAREGWPWHLDPDHEPIGGGAISFEAVVVRNWLGRFHLIGAVADELRGSPPGIWAVPDAEDFGMDGSVRSADPDKRAPEAAKRKPPEPAGEEDDIPF